MILNGCLGSCRPPSGVVLDIPGSLKNVMFLPKVPWMPADETPSSNKFLISISLTTAVSYANNMASVFWNEGPTFRG